VIVLNKKMFRLIMRKNNWIKLFLLKKRGSAGFTLIEVVIVLAIFSFMIGVVTQFSVNSIKSSARSRAISEAMDNARFAIDDLSKKARTSSQARVTGGGKKLFFVDNLTSAKYCYFFEDGVLWVKRFKLIFELDENGNPISILNKNEYDSLENCDSGGWNGNGGESPVQVIGTQKVKIDGNFDVMTTNIDEENGFLRRGFVRINVDLYYGRGVNGVGEYDPRQSAEVHIQSGVSLADYGAENGNL